MELSPCRHGLPPVDSLVESLGKPQFMPECVPPRIGLIGCGLIGQKRLNSLPSGRVTVACDLNLDRARKLAAQSPGCVATDSVVQAATSPNVDAVMIATLNASLAPVASLAVQAGKHVLVEKPAAVQVKQIEELAALAQQRGVQVRVGYNHR